MGPLLNGAIVLANVLIKLSDNEGHLDQLFFTKQASIEGEVVLMRRASRRGISIRELSLNWMMFQHSIGEIL